MPAESSGFGGWQNGLYSYHRVRLLQHLGLRDSAVTEELIAATVCQTPPVQQATAQPRRRILDPDKSQLIIISAGLSPLFGVIFCFNDAKPNRIADLLATAVMCNHSRQSSW